MTVETQIGKRGRDDEGDNPFPRRRGGPARGKPQSRFMRFRRREGIPLSAPLSGNSPMTGAICADAGSGCLRLRPDRDRRRARRSRGGIGRAGRARDRAARRESRASAGQIYRAITASPVAGPVDLGDDYWVGEALAAEARAAAPRSERCHGGAPIRIASSASRLPARPGRDRSRRIVIATGAPERPPSPFPAGPCPA